MELIPVILGIFAYLILGSIIAGIVVRVMNLSFEWFEHYLLLGFTIVAWPITLIILALLVVGTVSYNFGAWICVWLAKVKK